MTTTTTITQSITTATETGTATTTITITITDHVLTVVSPAGERAWPAPPGSRFVVRDGLIRLEATRGRFSAVVHVSDGDAWLADHRRAIHHFTPAGAVSAQTVEAYTLLESARIRLEAGEAVDTDTLVLARAARDEAELIMELLHDLEDAGLLPTADVDGERDGIDVQ